MAIYDGGHLRPEGKKVAYTTKQVQDFVADVRKHVEDQEFPIESVREVRSIARMELGERRQQKLREGMDLNKVQNLIKQLQERESALKTTSKSKAA